MVRMEGESIYYFTLHNIFSMLIFMTIINLGGYVNVYQTWTDAISLEFLVDIMRIFGLYIFSGILGRAFGFLFIRWHSKRREKESKKFNELDKGINKMSYIWIISLLIGAILFVIGAYTGLQQIIFGTINIGTIIITYLVVKIIIYLFLKWRLG